MKKFADNENRMMRDLTGKLISLLIPLFIIGYSISSYAEGGYIGGPVIENTTLTPADNPITVFDVVTVLEGVTLTIEPGTELNFMPGTHFEIYGILIASGTLLNPIVCRLIAQPGVPGNWNGIRFVNSHTILDEEGQYISGSILEHLMISEASTGISVTDSSKLLIRDISIEECTLNGVLVEGNSELVMENLNISDTQTGVSVNDSSILTINHLSVELCGYGIKVENQSRITLTESAITQCGYGISFKISSNCKISHCDITNCVFGIMFFSDPDYYCEFNLIENNNLSYNDNVALFMSPGHSKMRYNLIRDNIISFNNIGLHIGNGGVSDSGFNVITANHVFGNEFGIKISQSNDSVRFNLIEQNKIGILLNTACQNHLYGNLLYQNTEWAMQIEKSSNSNLIELNNIAENASAVKLSVKNGESSINNSFRYNSLSENTVTNFLILTGPQSDFVHNSIISVNDTASFINRTETDVIAINNYWGTTDTVKIDSIISDRYDYPQYGEVIYKPFDGSAHPESPITKPRMVIKRLVNTDVVVNWYSNEESDLEGYKVHLGEENLPVADVGSDTTYYTISGILLTEKIGVSAYDSLADGLQDKYEGHESYISYAVAGPYAGGINSVCSDANYFTSSATAIEYQSLLWTTDGDGTFADATTLHTYYVPGNNDKLAGHVNLTLKIVTSTGLTLEDELKLSILEYLIAVAGADTSIMDAELYNTGSAIAGNYMTLEWMTSGDGVFAHADSLVTDYIPGAGDKEAGTVLLTLRVTSGCGVLSDDIRIQIVRGFDISGTVYKENSPINEAVILAFNKLDESTRAVSMTTSGIDGKFMLKDVSEGDYYIYSVPDPTISAGYIPTYYAERFKWQDAWLMELDNDVFDVDIRLQPVDLVLPAGEGSISGSYLYKGLPGSDNSIFDQPWFDFTLVSSNSTFNEPVGNHVVLLMNPSLTKISGWTLSDLDGHFIFTGLPYGSYRLWGEKAGYANEISPVIYITPDNKNITDAALSVNVQNKTIESSITETNLGDMVIYPNPATDNFRINAGSFGEETMVVVQLINEKGMRVLQEVITRSSAESFGPVNITGLSSGLYFCIVTSPSGQRITSRIMIN